MKNVENIVDEKDMDCVSLTQSTIIRYTCPICGEEHTKQYKNYKNSQICRKCAVRRKSSKCQEDPVLLSVQEDVGKLKNYGTLQRVKFICESCGKETIIEKRSFDGSFLCSACKHSEAYKGYNEEKINEIVSKRRRTCLDLYGNEVYVNPKKIRETCLEKYGVDCVFQSKEFIEKKKKTSLERYGKEFYVNPEKTRFTMHERYGGYTWNSDGLRGKANKTLRERYGDKLEKIVEKGKKTKHERYGDDTYNNMRQNKKTCMERYGVDSYSKTDEYRATANSKYSYCGISFDSSWELYLWIYAIDNNIPIEREPTHFSYEYMGKEHFYFPDFLYDNELVEVKGGHFFDGNEMINPYDEEMNDLYESKHQCMVANSVKILTDIAFAKDYVEKKYTSDFVKLFGNKLKFPYLNEGLSDKSDIGLIHHFHKSIYEASVYGRKSPIEAWKDKEIIRKVALNRLKYIGKCRPSDILQGMNVTKIAPKVSIFNPKLATDIINNLSTSKTIFDPFSGFSGRMIGAFNNHRNYVGRDINEVHVLESIALADYIGFECDLSVQDIMTDVHKEMDETCLFTCPPYGNKEKWNENDIDLPCDKWIDICIDKYKCKEYVFVVDNTEKYKDYVVMEIDNQSHLGSNKEYIIKLDNYELQWNNKLHNC